MFQLLAVGGTCQSSISSPTGLSYDTTNATVVATAFGYFIVTLLFGGISGKIYRFIVP